MLLVKIYQEMKVSKQKFNVAKVISISFCRDINALSLLPALPSFLLSLYKVLIRGTFEQKE